MKLGYRTFNCLHNISAFTTYNPKIPFSMKFPGSTFCDGRQKLMIIASLPLEIRKVDFFFITFKKIKTKTNIFFLCRNLK
jgi:hypothetical protein